MKRGIAILLLCVAVPALARAQSVSDLGEGLTATPGDETRLELSGLFRVRAATFYNLDLDRGVTPSGHPLFPVPLSDPTSQTLSLADMRLRTDLGVFSPSGLLSAHARIDVLDNLVLGSTPEGIPATGRSLGPAGSPGQSPPDAALRIKRAYGQVLLPVGLLAAGRMGNQWGMGLVAGGGDCDTCDFGDSADRIVFVTPAAGHIWAVTYDFASTGPLTDRSEGVGRLDLDPSDNVRSVTFAALRYHSDLARARRADAGRNTIEYGLLLAYRWQNNDVPAEYLLDDPSGLGAGDVMGRGYRAGVADTWARFTRRNMRIEVEAAVLQAHVEQPSLVPGAEYRVSAESLQYGGAIQSEWTHPRWGLGVDAGLASGDPAPGFGAFPQAGAPAPVAGDLDGTQARLPGDNRVDNFRFHPDYRIDRILFREIIGTVTDAVYVRPHARVRIWEASGSFVEADVAGIASQAMFPESTPGGRRPLGVEIDPTLTWKSRIGFTARLEYGLLLPLAGLDNVQTGQAAQPAQLLRLQLGYGF